MPLDTVTAAAEEVEVSMDEDATVDVGEELNEVEEYAAEEFVKETADNIKMVFTSHMSPITLKIQSRPNSLIRHEKG